MPIVSSSAVLHESRGLNVLFISMNEEHASRRMSVIWTSNDSRDNLVGDTDTIRWIYIRNAGDIAVTFVGHTKVKVNEYE